MANLLKTDEQKQQEAEQAEKQMKEERFHELLKSASPEIIKQYGSQMMGEGEGGAGGGGSPPAGQLPS